MPNLIARLNKKIDDRIVKYSGYEEFNKYIGFSGSYTPFSIMESSYVYMITLSTGKFSFYDRKID